MSLAKWQKVIWKVRDSQHSLDWLLNRHSWLFCVCVLGWVGFTDTHAYACAFLHLSRGVWISLCFYMREKIQWKVFKVLFTYVDYSVHSCISCVSTYTCGMCSYTWGIKYVSVCCLLYAAGVLIPECCSLPEVRPWAASSVMSLLLKKVASQTNCCTKSVRLCNDWFKSWGSSSKSDDARQIFVMVHRIPGKPSI